MVDAKAESELPDTQPRTCILVVGMHRSGTSALARVLNLLGATLPKNIMGAGPGNETGHWEPIRLVTLHDHMLAEAGSSWNDWRPLDLARRLGHERLEYYRNEIRKLIEEEFSEASLFVLKDPRISRFVWLYREILQSMNVETRAILMLRNPLSVAGSLGERNEIEGAQAWLYWLRHVIDAEAGSRTIPRSVLSYEEVLEDWRNELSPVGPALDIEWPHAIASVADEIDAFLSTDQRHHAYTQADLDHMPEVANWIKRAYRAITNFSTDELDAIAKEFEAAVGLFSEALAAERATSEKLLTAYLSESQAAIAAARAEKDAALIEVRVESDLVNAETQALITNYETKMQDLHQREDKQRLEDEVAKASIQAELDVAIAELKSIKTELNSATASRDTLQTEYEAAVANIREELSVANFELENLANARDQVVSEKKTVASQLRAAKLELGATISEAKQRQDELYELNQNFERERGERKLQIDRLKKKVLAAEKKLAKNTREFEEKRDQLELAVKAMTPLRADYSVIATPSDEIEKLLRSSLLVIPSINGGSLLERMLPSLDLPSEQIVVLDQGSTDNTKDICDDSNVEIVQLGTPHTYTEACNIGLDIAKKRGCKYLIIANNDIVFTTRVAHELLAAMELDPNLAIVAPSQIIVDGATNREHLAYRVFWDLESMRFEHDFAVPDVNVTRLESDFCELTLAMVRVSATDEIGFLDNDYGFYFEDADFGFRVREAGFGCAYLVQSQIRHYHSSTFNRESIQRKTHYMEKNKRLFQSKHLGLGVCHADHRSKDGNSWNVINTYLHPYLRKFGLVDNSKPDLIFSHPGTKPFDFLYTVWETTQLPQEWIPFKNSYRATMATSEWVAEVFRDAGFENVSFVPLGVETDIFHPWGDMKRFSSKRTYLWFANNQYRKGLDVILKAWDEFHRQQPETLLVLMGRNIAENLDMVADNTRRIGDFVYSEFSSAGINVYENMSPVSAESLATIYRSVDFVLNTSRAEGFGLTVAEAMACGVPAIFGNYASTAEFVTPNALVFGGQRMSADYSDKGFENIGDWYEPDFEELVSCLHRSVALDQESYARLSLESMLLIRNRYTWRHTVSGIRKALQTDRSQTVGVPVDGAAVANEEPIQQVPTQEGNLAGVEAPGQLAIAAQPGGSQQVITETQKPASRARFREFNVRTMRRSGFLLYRCAEEYEHRGGRAAVKLAAKLVAPYLCSRAHWMRMRLGLKVPQWRKSSHALATAKQLVPNRTQPEKLSDGVLFIGYVEAGLGLGETLRAMIKAADDASISFKIYPFNVAVENRRQGTFMPERYATSEPHRINVMTVAADQVPVVFNSLPGSLLNRSYNILFTFWELPKAPEEWRPNLSRIDEIWAPNTFVAEAFKHIFEGPIHIVPPCVDVTSDIELPTRGDFGLDPDRFYFLYSFDYFSSPFRKNPLGVLAAFREAFPDPGQNVGLVIKSVGSKDHYPDIKDAIRQAIEEDPRIVSIDRSLQRHEMLGLINVCDSYVSLHRAEGFGYGMVEAMKFGKAVVGTKFSGSADFLNDDVAYPVKYTLRDVMPHEYVYTDGQTWAEPDHDDAVEVLRKVFDDNALRKKKSKSAITYSESNFGLRAVGKIVNKRILALKRKFKDT